MKNILLFSFLILFLFSGCKKQYEEPVIKNIKVHSVSPYSAIVEVIIQPNDIDVAGNINYIQFSPADNIENLSSENSFLLFRENNFRFVYGLNHLDPNTTYNVNACFKSVSPYEFDLKSHSISFTTGYGNSLYDARDGNYYKTIIIGTQEWMAENLRYSKNNIIIIDSSTQNGPLEDNYYNFQEALNVCPLGYKLPSDEDWMELEKSLGIEFTNLNTFGYRGDSIGLKLKAAGGPIWHEGNISTNSTGFSALPSGIASSRPFVNDSIYRVDGKGFTIRFITSSSDSNDPSLAIMRVLESNENGIKRTYGVKQDGYCVRCLKIKE